MGEIGNARVRAAARGGEEIGGRIESTGGEGWISANPGQPPVNPVALGTVKIGDAIVAAGGIVYKNIRASASSQQIVTGKAS